MLDNTQSIICAFGLAAAMPRSPYRHLELCGIALKRCVSGFAGWRAESFSADCFASAPSKELYAANGRGFSRTLANSPLDCLCPAVARPWVRIPSLREKQKALSPDGERAFCGRSDGIRTHGLLVPNQARYQLRYTPKKNPQQLCCCGGWG